jgi:hypothetical protein
MSEIGQKIIDEIRSVASQQPTNWVDGGSCIYLFYDGEKFCGSCLIGVALWNLKLINEDLVNSPLHGDDGTHVNTAKFHDVVKGGHFNFELEDLELQWIQDAQDAQDDSKTWSEAVAKADENQLLRLPH